MSTLSLALTPLVHTSYLIWAGIRSWKCEVGHPVNQVMDCPDHGYLSSGHGPGLLVLSCCQGTESQVSVRNTTPNSNSSQHLCWETTHCVGYGD